MNVHHLELFYYVAKYEGITAAVRKMPYGIQQPAVSGQLLQLEKHLGVKLFNRRPFSLTTAGDELYDHIYPFFSRLPDVEARLRGDESRHLRIAASASVMRHHLPGLLADMKNILPDLRLSIKSVEPADVHQTLTRQQADLAISLVHDRLDEGLKSVELMKLPLILLIPSRSKAKQVDDLLDDELAGKLPLVGLPPNELAQQGFDREATRRCWDWPVEVEVDSLDGVMQFVRNGFGVGLGVKIPGMNLPAGVKALDLTGFPPLVVGIIHQGQLKPIARAFLDAARARAKEIVSL